MSELRIIRDPRNLVVHEDNLSEKLFDVQLYESLCVPSTVHAYSCAIEYAKNWFMSKFDENYFNHVYVNGKNMYMDFKQFNKEEMLKRRCPMLAIIPSVNTDFDDNFAYQYEMPIDVWRRKRNFQQAFFQDKLNNIFLAMETELLEMGFSFKVRVETRAQQLDLWKYMQLVLRMGATHYETISVDFHIPLSLIFAIASMTNFKIIRDFNGNPVKLADPHAFLSYMNSNSALPITYKLRSINGNSEFFMRLKNIDICLILEDKINIDDGDQKAMISNNYHLEFSMRMRIPCPKYYALYGTNEVYRDIKLADEAQIGLFDIKIMEVPEVNDVGWHQYIHTEYCLDEFPEEYPLTINIAELLRSEKLDSVVTRLMEMGVSPSVFIEVMTFNDGERIPIKMQYNDLNDMLIVIENEIKKLNTYIVIYIDLEFFNNQIIEIEKHNENRLS